MRSIERSQFCVSYQGSQVITKQNKLSKWSIQSAKFLWKWVEIEEKKLGFSFAVCDRQLKNGSATRFSYPNF